jgi:hypothetical protein
MLTNLPPTIWEDLFNASWRDGWLGLLLALLTIGLAVAALVSVTRRRSNGALELTVLGGFFAGGYVCQGTWFTMLNSWATAGCCRQSAMLYWNCRLRLKLLLALIALLAFVAFCAIVFRPRQVKLRAPACLPGALISIAASILLDLFLIAATFGDLHRTRVAMDREEDARRSRARLEQSVPTTPATAESADAVSS